MDKRFLLIQKGNQYSVMVSDTQERPYFVVIARNQESGLELTEASEKREFFCSFFMRIFDFIGSNKHSSTT